MPHFQQKHLEVKHVAEMLFASKPDWMTFYREVMGLDGLIRRAFPNFEMMARFEKTETYREIHRMLAELRKVPPPKELAEDTKVITIRIPQSMHEALRIEAHDHRTTMNKLCISKLVQNIEVENVPTDLEKREPKESKKEAEAGL